MSNILEFFAPDMSTDFEELGEQINLDQIRSDEILSANSDQQNLPTNLLNVPNDENLIHRDSEYDSVDSKVDDAYEITLNKMSIKHLLQNDDVKGANYADYFSEITMNEDFAKKEITDDVEVSPLKPNLLNENDSVNFGDTVCTQVDDAMSLNENNPQQKDAMERESTSSDANEIETLALSSIFNTNLLNHVRSIHETASEPIINLSDNDIIGRASILEGELINSATIKKSGHSERIMQETAFESLDNLQNFDDKNMSTRALLLTDLAIVDNSSPVLEIEEIPNMSQFEINAQEVTANVSMNNNQIEQDKEQDVSDGSSELQFLPDQSKKDFECEHGTTTCQDNLIVSKDLSMEIPDIHNELEHDNEDIDAPTKIIVDTSKKEIDCKQSDENNEKSFHEDPSSKIEQDKEKDVSNDLPELQFLPDQSKKDFEREQDTTACQDNFIVSGDLSMEIPDIHNELEQIYDDNKDIGASTNIIVDISEKEIDGKRSDENNENSLHEDPSKIEDKEKDVSNGLPELQFLPDQSKKDFEREQDTIICQDNFIVSSDLSTEIPDIHNELVDTSKKEIETKAQPDSIEEETLLPSPSNTFVGEQNSDDEFNILDEKISFEHIDTEDNEIHLGDDNILPSSISRKQIKSEAEMFNDDKQDMNQSSTGEQIIEDTENVSTSEEELHSNESIAESIKYEIVSPTSPEDEQLSRLPSVIVTRSMIASLNLKDSTSSMSLDEKKQLLLEVRKNKSMLRSSILQNKQAQNVGEDNKNSLRINPRLSSPPKKAPNKLNNTALNRLTKQNTDKNKEYRCEFNVVVVRKNTPKPPSPTSKLHEKTRNGGITSALKSQGKDNMGSHIPILKSRGERQKLTNQKDSESPNRGVHWNESRLTQELSPFVKSSPRTARQRPIPKSCLKKTNLPIDSLGNVINVNSSLTPMVKRGIKVTVKQVKYKGEE